MPRVTALSKYQRLESPGIWRETPEAQRRDVIVSFGESSLALSDARSEMALTHWSLPALIRLNPGEMPALYTPGPEASETLELDDADMVGAIETVQSAIEARRPHPGRLRQVVTLGALALVVGGAVYWLPGALIRHTAQVVPASKRFEIGQMALADLTRVTGAACDQPRGRRALAQLVSRLFPEGGARVAVVPGGPARALHLPGGIVVLRSDLIETQDGPDVAAGYLLAERARAAQNDPLVDLLRWAGLRATVRLLTTGQLPAGALHGYGEVLLRQAQDPGPLPVTALLSRFKAEDLPSTPFAAALPSGTPGADALIAKDPFAKAPPPPLISDDAWVSLQDICPG